VPVYPYHFYPTEFFIVCTTYVTYPRQGTFILTRSALELELDNQRNCKSEGSQFVLLAKYWKIKRKGDAEHTRKFLKMFIKNITRKGNSADFGTNYKIILKLILKCGGVNGFHQAEESVQPLAIVKTVTVFTCCNSYLVSRRPQLQASVIRTGRCFMF
jgi:hypothetical protein